MNIFLKNICTHISVCLYVYIHGQIIKLSMLSRLDTKNLDTYKEEGYL